MGPPIKPGFQCSYAHFLLKPLLYSSSHLKATLRAVTATFSFVRALQVKSPVVCSNMFWIYQRSTTIHINARVQLALCSSLTCSRSPIGFLQYTLLSRNSWWKWGGCYYNVILCSHSADKEHVWHRYGRGRCDGNGGFPTLTSESRYHY